MHFTELASLAKYFLITLVVGCFTHFRMLSSSLNAILIYETPYFTELASLANNLLITLVVQCFLHFRMLYSSWDAILIYSITVVVGSLSYVRMIYSFLHAILIFESPYFTELASLVTYLSIPFLIKFLRTFKCFIHLWMLFWFMNLTSRSSLRSQSIFSLHMSLGVSLIFLCFLHL